MSEPLTNHMQRELASFLEPVRAPESLWYRVDAELRAPRSAPRRSLPRLALVFSLLLVAGVSAGWYFERPVSAVQPTPSRAAGQHACIACHS